MSDCFKSLLLGDDEKSRKEAATRRKAVASALCLLPLAAGASTMAACYEISLGSALAPAFSAISIGLPLIYLGIEELSIRSEDGERSRCSFAHIAMAVLGGAMLLCSNFNMLADGKAPIAMISIAVLIAVIGTWATVDRAAVESPNELDDTMASLSE